MFILFWIIAFALLMSTLFAIERKMARSNELKEELISLLRSREQK
ncbi:hypothetical protein [Salipaludibacillus aurantiacus]|uniref:Uncharacterized protein n=1 Tax=Salipaludibacillus aurantiacus TaxID=1601833 RepID=A0A1H9X881_9BACI|nr:hypothetical protein [Salipaludibacillus aurantiacus]SES42334.1 hypothetical protein SAMN05518684_12839 [Salipaludibacillus aurantiacus]